MHARSLMLSAPSEGLLAKLDLLETDGMVATPVDYKRGKAPSIPEGAYEPERIQLCAQTHLLPLCIIETLVKLHRQRI